MVPFITFEGGEGAGKSTQVRLLGDFLRSRGVEVLQTREPGGSPGAEQVRTLLVEGGASRWDAISETLLLYAARHDHVQKTIAPALNVGTWVICDRFTDSTLAYQGGGHGVSRALLDTLSAFAVGVVQPHLTFLLDMPVEQGLARARARGSGEDRFESMETSFHSALRKSFLDLAQEDPDRFCVCDATCSVDHLHTQIVDIIRKRFDV